MMNINLTNKQYHETIYFHQKLDEFLCLSGMTLRINPFFGLIDMQFYELLFE